MPGSADELVELLDLEDIDDNLFRGRQPDTERQRVFGGQVAAQALVAGVRTVDAAYVVHSLHSYFLRPGDTAVPIIYDVEDLRDGRSFATRRVVARQHGRPIYYQTANFQMPEDGLRAPGHDAGGARPRTGSTWSTLMRGSGDEDADALAKEWAAARRRGTSATRGTGCPTTPPTRRGPGSGSGSQAGLGRRPARAPGGLHLRQRHDACSVPPWCRTASHRPPQIQWRRWTTRSGSTGRSGPTSGGSTTSSRRRRTGGRGLALARVFTQDGRLVATVAQEGLIRLRR